MKQSLLIHSWSLHKVDHDYYLPYTHWVYLEEIEKLYSEIALISPIYINQVVPTNFKRINLDTIKIIKLPYSETYVESIKFFFSYLIAYKNARDYDIYYVRYPMPFGWLQKLFHKNKKRIIHFVGDPIDATLNNPTISILKKYFKILFFSPEYFMYKWACKGALVYTNGHHINQKLRKSGIVSIPVISTTLSINDFYYPVDKVINIRKITLLYVGYLRESKGVETVIKAFELLQKDLPSSCLRIIGSGNIEGSLKKYVSEHKINNITFEGHIDDRNTLNSFYRTSDFFCFASLSEGSPRVILEAMANGLNVISTPVGSLPYCFKDGQEISFFEFSDYYALYRNIMKLINNPEKTEVIRKNAYENVKQFTIQNFITKIFYVS